MFSQKLYFCALYVNAVVEFLEWDCSLFKGEFTILLKFSLSFFFFLSVQLEKERKAREEREKRDAEEAAERQRREEEWVRVITVVDVFFLYLALRLEHLHVRRCQSSEKVTLA